MTITEALILARDNRDRVRPTIWRLINPDGWVECRRTSTHNIFVECGQWREIPARMQLQHESELLGSWEVMPV